MDDKAKIATCQICTLSERMRVCDVCAFNIGLQYKQELKPVPVLTSAEREKKILTELGYY